MSIEVRHIEKRFGSFVALQDVSVQFPTGQLTALLGPSGCGKTTLLRIIAGLDHPDAGQVFMDQEDVSSVHVRDRNVGFVFQQYALFQHMTVYENIAFGLRVKNHKERPSEAQIKDKVTRLLSLIQLDWVADRFPSQLSGGQRQRIALARALAIEPRVLLLDEPFGALDAKVRKDLRRWLRHLHQELNVTIIFVTHDQEEALEVADQIVVMNKGQVEQIGSPDEVYNVPATPFVYNFLGSVNALHGTLDNGQLKTGDIQFDAPEFIAHSNTKGTAYVRPQDLDIYRYEQGLSGIIAQLKNYHAIGPVAQLELTRADNGELIEVVIPHESFVQLQPHDGESFIVQPKKMRIFVDETTPA